MPTRVIMHRLPYSINIQDLHMGYFQLVWRAPTVFDFSTIGLGINALLYSPYSKHSWVLEIA